MERNGGVSITYGSDGHTHIVTARAISEERKLYAARNKEGGREKTGALAQHSGYSGERMKTLFAQINAITDSSHKPTYEDTDELTQALQGLHMRPLLGIDDEGADEDGPNDIDISRMNGSARNNYYTIGGSPALQENLHALIKEYDDIFSYSVKGRSMDVPPMEFDVDKKLWEASAHRLASRQISIEKQTALSTLIGKGCHQAIQGHSVVPSTPGTKAK